MNDQAVRIVVRGPALGWALGVAFSWVLLCVVVTRWNGLPIEWVYAAYASIPMVLVIAGAGATVHRVVYADPQGIELVTEPFPLPLAGWSLRRDQVAFVSIEEHQHRNEDDWRPGYQYRSSGWFGARDRISWSVVLVERSGPNRTLATELRTAAEAKQMAEELRRVLAL